MDIHDCSRLRQGEIVGKKLPERVRSSYESQYGYSSRSLRVVESDLPNSLGVEALTRGNTIHFARGGYSPDSAHGMEVLSHELAHTVQQARGEVPETASVNSDPALEQGADQPAALSAPVTQGKSSLVSLPSGSSASPIQCWPWSLKSREKDLAKARKEMMAYYEADAKKRAEKDKKHRAQETLAQQQFQDETQGGWWQRRKAKKYNQSIRDAQEKVEHRGQKQLFMQMASETGQMQRLMGNSRGYDEASGKYVEGGSDDASLAGITSSQAAVSDASAQQRLEAAVGGLGLDIAGGLTADLPGYAKKIPGSAARLPGIGGLIPSVQNGLSSDLGIGITRYAGGGLHAAGGIMEAAGAGIRANKARKAGDTAGAWQAGLQSLAGASSGSQGVAQMAFGGAATMGAGSLASQVIPGVGAFTGAAKMASGVAGLAGNGRSLYKSNQMLKDERLADGYQSSDTDAQNSYESLRLLHDAAKTRTVEAGFDTVTGALDMAAGITNAAGGGGGAGTVLTGLSAAGKAGKFAVGKGMRSHYAKKQGAEFLEKGFAPLREDDRFYALSDREKSHYIKNVLQILQLN